MNRRRPPERRGWYCALLLTVFWMGPLLFLSISRSGFAGENGDFFRNGPPLHENSGRPAAPFSSGFSGPAGDTNPDLILGIIWGTALYGHAMDFRKGFRRVDFRTAVFAGPVLRLGGNGLGTEVCLRFNHQWAEELERIYGPEFRIGLAYRQTRKRRTFHVGAGISGSALFGSRVEFASDILFRPASGLVIPTGKNLAFTVDMALFGGLFYVKENTVRAMEATRSGKALVFGGEASLGLQFP